MAGKKSTTIPELTATRFNQRQYQLQRKNHFEVFFGSNDTVTIDPELKFMVVSFPLPKETTEATDVNYFNQTIKTAANPIRPVSGS